MRNEVLDSIWVGTKDNAVGAIIGGLGSFLIAKKLKVGTAGAITIGIVGAIIGAEIYAITKEKLKNKK